MSDLGLGSLIELKRHLIANNTAETTYDTTITELGRGVARGIDRFCNRQMARVAGATYDTAAEVDHIYLPRFPVESVASISLKTSQVDGFVALDSTVILNRDDSSGLVMFGAPLSDRTGILRVTYTGGYWFDTTEDGTGVMPAAATLLPYDVSFTWKTQCRRLWELLDKLGTGLAQLDRNRSAEEILSSYKFIDGVKEFLIPFIRYAMT